MHWSQKLFGVGERRFGGGWRQNSVLLGRRCSGDPWSDGGGTGHPRGAEEGEQSSWTETENSNTSKLERWRDRSSVSCPKEEAYGGYSSSVLGGDFSDLACLGDSGSEPLRQDSGNGGSDISSCRSHISNEAKGAFTQQDTEEMTLELPESQPDFAQAMLAQSQALTALVAQIANGSGDPFHDLGTTSGSLSPKGSTGQARLQAELAAHRGTFFTSILQSMSTSGETWWRTVGMTGGMRFFSNRESSNASSLENMGILPRRLTDLRPMGAGCRHRSSWRCWMGRARCH